MADVTVVWDWVYYGKSVKNVTCFNNASEDTVFAEDFAESIAEQAPFLAWMAASSNQLELASLTFRFDNDGSPWSVTQSVGVTGGVSGDGSPAQVAALATLAYAGPAPNRGRMYLPGVPEGAVSGGLLSVPYGAAVYGFVNFMANDGVPVTAGDSFLRIARRDLAGRILTSSSVDSVIVRQNVATQRRRRLGQS